MSNSTSIVPLVLWGKTPPSHTVSVLTCTYDQKTIITGSTQGQICLWDLRHTKDSGLKVVPRNFIFAHGCKILSIACALDSSYERPNIISLAENGEFCLWDIEDGLCLQINTIPGTHTGLYSIQVPRGSVKEWRVVCYGMYSDIHVIDTLTLQILYTLKSKIAPNWISAVCILRPARKKEDILCGLTVSSHLKVWPIRSSHEIKGDIIYEQESKQLDCMKAKKMCSNPFTQRTVLIISAKAWQIFDASDFSFLAAMPSPHPQPLVSGSFVATNRVLVWDKMGRSFLYKLPSRYLLGAEGSDQMTSDKSSRAPVLICEFEAATGSRNFDSPMFFSYGRRGPYYKLLLQGYNGGVCVWKVPDSEQADILLSREANSSKPVGVSEVTIADEGVRKVVEVEEQLVRFVPCVTQASFREIWQHYGPVGLLDGLEEEESKGIGITASLYLPSQGRMVCGRANGTIVVIAAIRAALVQLLQPNNITRTDWPPHLVLHGHSGPVTCLLYPHDENPRYNMTLLISGGADFTVRIWDVFNGTVVHSFSPHGGQVTRLMVTPPECNSRFLSCICSVAQDHSVALLGLRERKIVLLASRHTFPVETIRWRPKDDFMVVGCSDGTVYVWQMETGHLDRCVAGSVAFDILESCHEDTAAPTPALREHQRKFRLHHQLTNMAHQLPIEFRTPGIVKKMKSRISTMHQHVSGNRNASSPSSSEEKKQPSPLPPMRVCALRTCLQDPDIHVILLDPEALIRQLLSEEADYISSTADLPVNPKRQERRSTSDEQLVKTKSNKKLSDSVSYEIAQLLLSCCHGWGLDPGLDDTCVKKLGMLKPVKPLSFGLLTRGRLSLMFLGWYISGQEDSIAGALEEGLNPEQEVDSEELDASEVQKIQFNAHWQLSSSLSTQHLISIVAVTNTLMSMNYVSFIAKSTSNDGSGPQMVRAEVKAGWSLLAALHCCLLPDAMKGFKYRPPLLHILARRWQDRCLEIREAAQAILLAELQRIGPKGRKQLIDAWSPHLPQDIDATDFGFEDLEQYINNEEDKPIVVTAEEERSDIAMVMMTTKKMVSGDVKLRHATAIIMLGVIGAEFQREVDPVNRDTKGSGLESAMDVNTVRNTAKALTTLLLQRQSSKTPVYSAIRRAAIDLIGRGFALWEPHIDVSQVLIGLLELCADIESRMKSERSKTFSISAAKDLHRSSRHSLSLIATGRPSACITTLAKEVARHVASTSSMSFTQPSPAAIAVYSHVRHQPPQSGESQFSCAMHNTRSEILRIIELMIEKNQQEVIDFIVEVVDIVVHMLDYKSMKEKGLTEVFPALFKFSMVAYCSQTRRLAVGSRLGHIALYELRSSRCQLIPAHDSPITSLSFSPEGKVLASFSMQDSRISFWQTSTSLLGMLSSTIKCIQSYATNISNKPLAMKNVRILWTSKKHVVLVLGDGSQHKFSI